MSGSAAAVLTKPAFRKIEWLARDIAVERRPDGVIVLKSRIPLQPYDKHIPAALAKWALAVSSRETMVRSAARAASMRTMSLIMTLLDPASIARLWICPRTFVLSRIGR